MYGPVQITTATIQISCGPVVLVAKTCCILLRRGPIFNVFPGAPKSMTTTDHNILRIHYFAWIKFPYAMYLFKQNFCIYGLVSLIFRNQILCSVKQRILNTQIPASFYSVKKPLLKQYNKTVQNTQQDKILMDMQLYTPGQWALPPPPTWGRSRRGTCHQPGF